MNRNQTKKKQVKPEKLSQTEKLIQTGKPIQTEKIESNQFEPVFVLKNRTKPKPVSLNRFRFFLKNFSLVIFLDKNQTKLKIITSNRTY